MNFFFLDGGGVGFFVVWFGYYIWMSVGGLGKGGERKDGNFWDLDMLEIYFVGRCVFVNVCLGFWGFV